MKTAKKSVVDTLVSQISKESNFLLVKFEKTSHQNLEALRRELKKTDTSFKVIKNTLLEKAFNKLGQSRQEYRELKKRFMPLRDVTALMTFRSADWSNGLKAFHTFAEKEKSLGFKFGLLDATAYDADTITKIAKLPGKNELVGKLLGSMKSPTFHVVNAMKFNMQKFVYVLSQKSKQN